MIAYHGSSKSGLKKLEYSEENSRFGGEANLVHGAGIYLTTTSSEAMAYSTASLYTVKVSGFIFDATDESVLKDFIVNLFKSWNLKPDLVKNHSIQRLIQQTARGQTSGVGFGDGIFTILTNEESLYNEILHEKFNDDIDKLEDSIKSAFSYKLIKVHHQGNGTDWIICLDHDGKGLEIIEESPVE